MAKRRYKVFQSFGSAISITDEVTPLLQLMYLTSPNIFLRAARHAGFETQKKLKKEIRAGFVAGTKTKDQSFITKPKRDAMIKRYRKYSSNLSDLEQHFRRKRRFTGRLKSSEGLAKAIGYEKTQDGVEIGWLSRSAAVWGSVVQDGSTTLVTPKMKKYLAAIGLATQKRVFTMPRQRIIAPFFMANRRWMLKLVEDRFNKKFFEEFSRTGRLAS